MKKDPSILTGAYLFLFDHKVINGIQIARTYARKPYVLVEDHEDPDRKRWRKANSAESKMYYSKKKRLNQDTSLSTPEFPE